MPSDLDFSCPCALVFLVTPSANLVHSQTCTLEVRAAESLPAVSTHVRIRDSVRTPAIRQTDAVPPLCFLRYIFCF